MAILATTSLESNKRVSTLLNTYGNQEGEAFNYHYQAHGYHPLLCFDGITGDLLKAELRDGTHYCSRGSGAFMVPLMQEFREKYPSLGLYLRGDSGFAAPELYEACEENDCKYAIRLKENQTLRSLAAEENSTLMQATKDNKVDYVVTYGEFSYQAGSWSHPRRVVFKIEKPANQFIHMYTFVVTTMEMEPYQVIRFYCGRGKMENFIKEAKSGFNFSSVSSHSRPERNFSGARRIFSTIRDTCMAPGLPATQTHSFTELLRSSTALT